MITVRFSPGTDHERVRSQGTLLTLPSDRVYAAQRDAVAQLRRGDSRNPGLLDILMAESYSPYEPRVDVKPGRALDADQLDAFQRALSVPDVLNVLGPPGTGKTTTIVEVIRACVREGQRVLVTAPTHRAVDSVLESLPPELDVVRIGAEDSMGAKVQAITAQSREQTVRRQILADTSVFDTLTEVQRARQVLDWHLAHLHSQLQIACLAFEEHGIFSCLIIGFCIGVRSFAIDSIQIPHL
jgi:molybdopterin-guanine dinucleotide biosynthesis protein